MFIQTESTPNPQTLKFLPDVPVMAQGTAFFTNVEDAARSPLAVALFRVPGVTAVFLGADFVTVTKADDAQWPTMKPGLLTAIMEHFVAGRPVLSDNAPKAAAAEDDDAIVTQIKELIETRIRPAVAMDGGDILFHSFEEGIVRLEMHGSCSGCPSSTATLKNGIENMLKHYIPEVLAVEAVA